MNETRAGVRIRQRLTARFATKGGEPAEAYTGNVSAGGLYLISAKPAPVAEMVMVELALPDASALAVEGRVVWNTQHLREAWGGFGVQITRAPQDWYEYFRRLAGPNGESHRATA